MSDERAKEMPIGFTMSLAMNESAMERFAGMDEKARQEVIEESRTVKSKAEMEHLVDRLGNEGMR